MLPKNPTQYISLEMANVFLAIRKRCYLVMKKVPLNLDLKMLLHFLLSLKKSYMKAKSYMFINRTFSVINIFQYSSIVLFYLQNNIQLKISAEKKNFFLIFSQRNNLNIFSMLPSDTFKFSKLICFYYHRMESCSALQFSFVHIKMLEDTIQHYVQ